jgi:hypothetical protein
MLASSVYFEVKFESVAFVDVAEARTFNCADMDEGIFLAIIARDEAKTLHGVEELDRTNGLFTRQLALRGLGRGGDNVTYHLEVSRRNLAATIDEVELQFLTLGQTCEPGAFDLADMDEHVLAALIALDEAEPLLGIEEFYLALASPDDLRWHSATTRSTAAATAATTAAVAKTATAIAATVIIEAASAATETVPTAKAVTATSPVISTHRRHIAATERIETFFTKTIPLVAPPAATTSVVTHVPT